VHSLSRSNEMPSVRSLAVLAVLSLVVLLATPAAAAHEAEAATAQLVQTARGSIERLKARIQHPTASQQELVEQVNEEALLLESQAEAEATWCNPQGERQGPTTRQRPKRKLHLHDRMLTRVSFLSCVCV
jgi:predicted PurR-regulated permease PerM